MFDPGTDNSEFFEIYNASDIPVQIGGWKFRENSGKCSSICKTEYWLEPGKFFVVASDSLFLGKYNYSGENYSVLNRDLSLGNDEDEIVLLDFHDRIIDSVRYFSSWHNPNFVNTNDRSLERINPEITGNNPDNWSSSLAAEKATPGKVNSVFQKNGNPTEEIAISPNPFSPDNDGFEDVTFISYKLSGNINLVRARIYDSKGRLVRTLTDDYPTGAGGEIIFDGRNENGTALPMGIYILLFEEISNGKTLKKFVKPFVIARKLR